MRGLVVRTRNSSADCASIAFRFPLMCICAYKAEKPRALNHSSALLAYSAGETVLTGSYRWVSLTNLFWSLAVDHREPASWRDRLSVFLDWVHRAAPALTTAMVCATCGSCGVAPWPRVGVG